MASKKMITFCIVLLSLFISVPEAAYFYVSEGSEKCFVENVPRNIPLTVSYDNRENPGVDCSILFKDPNGRVVYSRLVDHKNPKSKVAYLTKESGEYKVCIQCDASKWFSTSKLKWSITIELGDTDLNLEDAATKDHMTELEMIVRQIAMRFDAIAAENEYEEYQENEIQETSEKIKGRVVYLAVVQIMLLVVSTMFSVIHLKRFFYAQKLI